MKNKCYSYLVLLGAMLLGLPMVGRAQFTFDYELINGAVTIVNGSGSGVMVVPGTSNGVPVGAPVKSIDTMVFSHYRFNLTGVVITNGITTTIGKAAFTQCQQLTNVTLGASVTNIGAGAFYRCTNLSSITIDPLNPSYSSVTGAAGVFLYNKSQTALYQCPVGTSGNFVVPDGVTNIGELAFAHCSGLTGITFPSSVISIGDHAFSDCTNLTSVSIPGNVASIGNFAFALCSGLTNITFGSGVTSIGSFAFITCSNLTSVTLPDSITSIGNDAFDFCTGLTNVTFGAGVTTVGNSAFWGCLNLPGVSLPSSVASIGNYAFWGCTGLPAMPIGSNVTNIGTGAFYWCTSLGGITVDPANSTYSSVNGVLFNKSQTTLIQYPQGKSGNYTVPNGVTTIGPSAFSDCSILNGVTLSASVLSLGDFSFSDCDSLASIKIPNTVTNIGAFVFSDCIGLTNVTIGSNVIGIGSGAFDRSYNLIGIDVVAGNPVYSSVNGVLFNASQTTLILCPIGETGSYVIPTSVTSIGTFAFSGCANLTGITIGNNVANMGNYVFNQCPGLLTIFFKGSVPSIQSPGAPFLALGDTNATFYYLPGTAGWTSTYGGRPALLWNPQMQTSDASFGVRTNQFGFNITGTANIPVVVEVCTNLGGGAWVPLQYLSLTNGSTYFSDPQWANFPSRFYRFRSP